MFPCLVVVLMAFLVSNQIFKCIQLIFKCIQQQIARSWTQDHTVVIICSCISPNCNYSSFRTSMNCIIYIKMFCSNSKTKENTSLFQEYIALSGQGWIISYISKCYCNSIFCSMLLSNQIFKCIRQQIARSIQRKLQPSSWTKTKENTSTSADNLQLPFA